MACQKIPYAPAIASHSGLRLDIKKTSYKKVSRALLHVHTGSVFISVLVYTYSVYMYTVFFTHCVMTTHHTYRLNLVMCMCLLS